MRTKKKEELRSNLCVRILLRGSFVKQQYTVETCVVSKKKEPRTLKERRENPSQREYVPGVRGTYEGPG